jgi:DNA-binding transcriptional LysR family regulator
LQFRKGADVADWDDLRVFLAVARTESLSGAGKALRIDPATVGRRIGRLEEALGARLFAKSPQGYALTGEGQRLQPHAEAAEQAMLAAVEDLRGAAGALSGQVRIGAPDGCANYLLPQVVAAICDANPGLEVQIVALPRVFNLSKREADMAVAVSPPPSRRLTVQKLTDYHLHLAASRAYLADHPAITTRASLKAHRVVGYIPDMIFDKELDYLAEIGAETVPLASNSVSVQLNWLRQGAGLGIVHDFAMPSAPELVKVLADQISLTRAFWLIRHVDDRRAERLNRFADLLAQGLRREVLRLEALT